MVTVTKRDGREVDFDISRIKNAIRRAFVEVDDKEPTGNDLQIIEDIANTYNQIGDAKLDVESIQDDIIFKLMSTDRKDVAKAYTEFRYLQNIKRTAFDKTILEIVGGTSEYWSGENSNKNPRLNTTVRDYLAGQVSTDISERVLLPKEIMEAHKAGIIHFHDIDYFAQPAMYNCSLVNLKDMLTNDTVISETLIESPHIFSTACTITTQIIAQVASSQYGGQSISLAHLAPFVEKSRKRFRKQIAEALFENNLIPEYDEEHPAVKRIAEKRLKEDIAGGIQTIQYQITTLMTTNGQAPFITIFMYLNEAESESEKKDLAMLIEEMLNQSIRGVKNEEGVWITPSFPKLIYVLQEDNIEEGTEYWELTKLAAYCCTRRLTPDYISEKVMKELKEGYCFPVMGCRSALSPWYDEEGNAKFYGRFNKGVVTLNLVDLAFSSGGNMDKFWELFEERSELCHRALLCRYERLKGGSTDVAPILWRHGAISRLSKEDTIDSLLVGGYSSISLGYAGLYECVKFMTGCSHSDEGIGEKFGLEVMEAMNRKCDEWNEQLNLGFGIYGTPIESTTYKFAKKAKERFGDDVFVKLDGCDRNYITNSYHIPVFEKIDAFNKLRIEAKFQKLSKGGAISYVECPNLENNLEAAIQVIQFIYNTNMYAELNIKSDYCQKCGWDREIDLIDEDGVLIWKCPNCGNTDVRTMDITRRTCGLTF